MDKRRLGILFFVLLLLSFSLVACDDDDEDDDGATTTQNVSEVSEIRYHAQIGDHCETIRIFPPRLALDDKEMALLLEYFIDGPDALPPESKADFAVLKEKISKASIVLATSRGVFRGKIGTRIDDLGGTGVDLSLGTWLAVVRKLAEVDLRWERFVPGERSWEGKWEPAAPPEGIVEAVRGISSGSLRTFYEELYDEFLPEPPEFPGGISERAARYKKITIMREGITLRIKGDVLELWDPACLPRKSLTSTPTTALYQIVTVAPPTPTPTESLYRIVTMPPPPTPTPTTQGGGTAAVSFYLRPGQGDPCTKVLFRFQAADAQGRPDFTQPFDIVLYDGRIRYRVALTPDTVAYLDEQYARVSPTRFRELLAQRLKEEYRRHMYTGQGSTIKMSWGFTEQIQTGFRPLRIFKPEWPVIQILARLWAVRATQQGWWKTQGVAWKDPACEPRPTPTQMWVWVPTPTSSAYGVPASTPTPGLPPTPTPTLPPGVPTYTPVPTHTPAPTPTPPPQVVERPDLAQGVMAAINAYRQQNGLPPLNAHSALVNAAREQALCMARTGRVTHTGCDGSSPADRAARYGYSASILAENVGNGPANTGIVGRWMGSEGHRSNILHEAMKHVGAGAACAAGVCYFVALFGAP